MTNTTDQSTHIGTEPAKPSIRKPFGAVIKVHAAEQAAHRKLAPRNSPWQTAHASNRHYLRHLSLAYAFARGAVYAKIETAPKEGKRERASAYYICKLLTEVLPAVVTADTEKNIGKWLRGKYPTPPTNPLSDTEEKVKPARITNDE